MVSVVILSVIMLCVVAPYVSDLKKYLPEFNHIKLFLFVTYDEEDNKLECLPLANLSSLV
jgi:hypothetical protein